MTPPGGQYDTYIHIFPAKVTSVKNRCYSIEGTEPWVRCSLCERRLRAQRIISAVKPYATLTFVMFQCIMMQWRAAHANK